MGAVTRVTRAARVELAVIAVGAILVGLAAPLFARRVALADLVLAGAALILVQGLARDVARLRAARREAIARRVATDPAPRRAALCTCVESGLGVSAVVAGAVLVFAGSAQRFTVPSLAWPALFASITLLGWVVRDVVFDARRRRLRVERDHASLDVR